jgi:hypothetical protein
MIQAVAEEMMKSLTQYSVKMRSQTLERRIQLSFIEEYAA